MKSSRFKLYFRMKINFRLDDIILENIKMTEISNELTLNIAQVIKN